MNSAHARLGCTQRAYFYFARNLDFGDAPYSPAQLDQLAFDPDQVTALVGLAPTSSWRRGDPHPSPAAPGPRRFASWKHELPAEQTYYTEDVVRRLLETIEPYADGIRLACDELGLQTGINLVIQMEGSHDEDGDVLLSTAAICYSADTLQRLVRLGLAIDHDQYVAIET